MAPKDPKQGGGFFASIASTFRTVTKSVNGLVGYEGLEVINPDGGTDDVHEEASKGRWKQEDRDGYWKVMQKYVGADVTSMVTLSLCPRSSTAPTLSPRIRSCAAVTGRSCKTVSDLKRRRTVVFPCSVRRHVFLTSSLDG
ncbi:hypothetical protein ABKV19_016941 [Rosa sericea]